MEIKQAGPALTRVLVDAFGMGENLAVKVLVTGGMGYIGKAVVALLQSSGFEVVVLDNYSTSKKPLLTPNLVFVEGDYGDEQVLRELEGIEVEAIIHLANSAYVGESMSDPMKYFQNNVAKTITLLDWAQKNEVRNIVFSSSCATYGAPNTALITEQTPQKPINPYGESKLMIEKILDWLSELKGFSHVSLRYFNVAGNSSVSDARDEHDPEPHLLPRLIGAAKSGTEFSVYGTKFNTPDGSAVRDFIHVDDLANAHLLALRHLLDGGETLRLNLGTGSGTSVLQLAKSVQDRFGHFRINVEEQRPGDPATLVASNTMALQKLGWSPTRSKIDQILDSIQLG